MWDAVTGAKQYTFEGHESPVYSVCPHHKENIQVSRSHTTTISIFSLLRLANSFKVLIGKQFIKALNTEVCSAPSCLIKASPKQFLNQRSELEGHIHCK